MLCLLFSFKEMFKDLGDLLCTITGFDSFSLQPNAGAAGEYAGLMVIRAFHMVSDLNLQAIELFAVLLLKEALEVARLFP